MLEYLGVIRFPPTSWPNITGLTVLFLLFAWLMHYNNLYIRLSAIRYILSGFDQKTHYILILFMSRPFWAILLQKFILLFLRFNLLSTEPVPKLG
jgi:hypothetical protein